MPLRCLFSLAIMPFTPYISFFFFFNDTATTEIYTLSLHDALPISTACRIPRCHAQTSRKPARHQDRKSTRLNSSHSSISYAVFCLKKKKKILTFFFIEKKKKKLLSSTL